MNEKEGGEEIERGRGGEGKVRERKRETKKNNFSCYLLTSEALLCLLLASGINNGLTGICVSRGPPFGDLGGLMVRSVMLVGLENE